MHLILIDTVDQLLYGALIKIENRQIYECNSGVSPQLECWNNGIMALGILYCWVNGNIHLDDTISESFSLRVEARPYFQKHLDALSN